MFPIALDHFNWQQSLICYYSNKCSKVPLSLTNLKESYNHIRIIQYSSNLYSTLIYHQRHESWHVDPTAIRFEPAVRTRTVSGKPEPEPKPVWPGSETNRNQVPTGPIPFCHVQNWELAVPVMNLFFKWRGRRAQPGLARSDYGPGPGRPWGQAPSPGVSPILII